jgi:DNA-binding HxlR family transcriptional regulator
VALEGPLKEFHIQDVFQLLDLGRKSGVLRVTSELRQTAASVSFKQGGVVAATLGKNPQRFGARLVRMSKISAKDLDRALAMQEKGDSRRLGEILVAIGAISRRELERQLKAQVEETILDLLGWTEGHFRFEEGATCEALIDSPVRISTEGLLMESARRLDEWSRIEAKVPHLRVVPKLPPPDAPASGQLDLVPFEWEVLAAVDGHRDLHALAETLGRSEFDVARTVYALAAAGVIVLDDRGGPSESGRDPSGSLAPVRQALAKGEFEKAATALQEVLRKDPLMPEGRRLFGVCQAALGRFRGAAETWKGWARLGTRTPSEEALAPVVDRLRQAAEILAEELESYRD